MDGVIIDSESSHEEAFRRTLGSYGYSLDLDEYHLYFAGKTDKAGFEAFADNHPLPSGADLLAQKSRAYELLVAEGSLKPYNETIAVIRALSLTYPLALVTGSNKTETTLALRSLAIDQYFNAIVTADDVNHGKPDPEPYRRACQQLDLAPADCVAIEDSPSGISSAKQAGLYCIALTTTHADEALDMADRVVPSLRHVFSTP